MDSERSSVNNQPGTKTIDSDGPEDRYNLCYYIFFLLGLGMLFPWNAFITAQTYFQYRVCNSDFESSFMNVFTISFTICNLLGLVWCLAYSHNYSSRRLSDVPLMILVLVFGLTTLLVLDSSFDPELFFWMTAASCCIAGLATAIFQGGIFGLAAMLPPAYIQAVMSGQGFAGITISLSSLITTWTSKSTDAEICSQDYENFKWSAFSYFAFSCAVLVLSIFCFYLLETLEFYQYWINKPKVGQAMNVVSDASDQIAEPLLEGASGDSDGSVSGLTWGRLTRIFKEISDMAICVCLVFAITLFVFPATTAQIKSVSDSDSDFYGKLWIPISFLNFSLFDFVGRLLAGAFPYKGSPKSVWVPTLLRLICPVIFLLSNTGDESHIPNVINNDWINIANMALFGTTNGYMGSVLMMMAPSTVSAENAQNAGVIMSFFLTLGLMAGSLFSFALLPFV